MKHIVTGSYALTKPNPTCQFEWFNIQLIKRLFIRFPNAVIDLLVPCGENTASMEPGGKHLSCIFLVGNHHRITYFKDIGYLHGYD